MAKNEQKVKTKLRIGDTVVKITGKDKGKTGEIMAIDEIGGRVTVKGVNVRKKFQKTQENPKGVQVEIEGPIHISNVMLYDSKAKKGTRVTITREADSKGKVKTKRIAKTSGKEI